MVPLTHPPASALITHLSRTICVWGLPHPPQADQPTALHGPLRAGPRALGLGY